MDGDWRGLGVRMATHLGNLDPHVSRQHRIGKRQRKDIAFRPTRRLKLLCNLNQPNYVIRLHLMSTGHFAF